MAAEEKKSSVGKVIGIGCLTIIVILVIGGIVVVKNFKKIGRSVGAKAVETLSAQMLAESGLTATEQKAIMKPVRELSADIKSGAISLEQMGAIMEELSQGALPSIITVKAVEVKYLEPSTLSAGEKESGRRTLSRYVEACMRNNINANAESEGIHKIIMVETKDSVGDSTTRMRDKLSDPELQQVLTLMKSSADSANIPNKTFKTDIAKAITDAIERGKAKSSE